MEEKNYGENYLGNVIRIISKSALIVDVGEDYLTVGDKIQIYEPSEEILDLEGNSLGIYENIKATLDVIQTSSNYSVCEKRSVKETNLFTAAIDFSTKIVSTIDLNVNEDDIKPLDIESSNKINIGDAIKKR